MDWKEPLTSVTRADRPCGTATFHGEKLRRIYPTAVIVLALERAGVWRAVPVSRPVSLTLRIAQRRKKYVENREESILDLESLSCSCKQNIILPKLPPSQALQLRPRHQHAA